MLGEIGESKAGCMGDNKREMRVPTSQRALTPHGRQVDRNAQIFSFEGGKK